ncbi:SBDS protein C-terminal domain-containing protein [Kockiozyma suomiensis]|uniref:SBDS protein C-terminal domain-containing protein n=1 Tax=Kockiozyma suomiensis TaxID=1337062 RepID=UPI0033434098
MPINQPSNQIKLTNVSLVRMRKGKKRFELACYQNKVQDWRLGVETDLDEVLQIPNVFLNVSKGQVAPNEDLKASFGTTDQDKIILEILKKGELQVGEKERQAKLQQQHATVIDLITSRCVNPATKRPYPTTIIEKALSELGFNIVATKNAKAQALDAIKQLIAKQIVPIARARMRVRVTADAKEAKKYRENITALIEQIETEDWSQEWACVGFIEPGKFRDLGDVLQKESKGRANVEVLDMAVIQEGEEAL